MPPEPLAGEQCGRVGARRRFACARLVGAEGGNGRKVLKDKTNTPRIMPAPAVSSAIRKIRGKA